MRKDFLTKIINSRTFYVKTYRRAGWALICSLFLNLLVLISIIWVHMHEPDREFYASSGVSPPIRLVALNAPNMKAIPILGSASEEA